MSSRKKMIFAVSAFAMIVLASVVTLVSVLAATSVKVDNTITVKYTVTDVICDVEVYVVKVKTNDTSITWGTAKGTHNFTHDTATEQKTFALGSDFTLLKDECVLIKFVFNNNGDLAFKATLSTPKGGTNMAIAYAATASKPADIASSSFAAVSVDSGASASSTYYAKISISDVTKNATIETSFVWNLAKG